MTNIEFHPSAIDAGGCISNAWEMLKANYGIYLGISVLAMVLTGCIPCINLFLIGPIAGGIYYVVLRDMRGEPIEFGMMFKGFEKFVPLMVIGLIQSIPGILAQTVQYGVRFGELASGGFGKGTDFDFFQASSRDTALAGGMAVILVIVVLAFMIFSVVWWAVFFFAVPLAMEYDLGPIDAIKLSARAGISNIGGLVVLLIFEALVAIVGLLLICLGLFFISVPLIYIANAFAYRQVFPFIGQQFNMAPPPPTTYGFGGGQPGY
ncbi:MAG: hypothetical protein ACKVQW_07720 [Pyrinomonadaceae bacterium]